MARVDGDQSSPRRSQLRAHLNCLLQRCQQSYFHKDGDSQLARHCLNHLDHLCSQCARKIKNHEVGKYQSCMVSYQRPVRLIEEKRAIMAREGDDLWAAEVQVDGIALALHELAAGEQLSRVIGRKMDHLCSRQCARARLKLTR